jgi:hypothetical protein
LFHHNAQRRYGQSLLMIALLLYDVVATPSPSPESSRGATADGARYQSLLQDEEMCVSDLARTVEMKPQEEVAQTYGVMAKADLSSHRGVLRA